MTMNLDIFHSARGCYQGVVRARLLDDDERTIRTSERQTPLVIEPLNRASSGLDFLRAFVSEHSTDIIEDLALHGAVLFRGFEIRSDGDFELIASSISGMPAIGDAFMAEVGRTTAKGTRFVLQTNTMYKTGGSFYLGGFHTENYYNPDVPRIISFACFVPSWIGGETGLVNVAALYRDLPSDLQQQLEESSFLVYGWPVSNIAARYAPLSQEDIEEFCENVGLAIVENDGVRYAVMYKPVVLQHPVDGERTLAFNDQELRHDFGQALKREFIADFDGWRWGLHRAAWRSEKLTRLITVFDMALTAPSLVINRFRASPSDARDLIQQRLWNRQGGCGMGMRLGDVLTAEQTREFAALLRAHFCSFRWKRGDVLFVDNLKMAHAGMPGLGPRRLRALICSPMRLPYSRSNTGSYRCSDLLPSSLGQQLQALRVKALASAHQRLLPAA
jgi:alpha-ketoglutarate-dependent taurine dioxygenase